MKYHEILKALIGIPSLSARLDNPFPSGRGQSYHIKYKRMGEATRVSA